MKTHIVVLALILLVFPVSAQTEQATAGITPDSPLWHIDIAIERLTEIATLNNEKRIELQLKHADERIAEAKVSQNPDKAIEQYNKILNRINIMESNKYSTSQMIREKTLQHEATLETLHGVNISETIKQERMLRITTAQNEKDIQETEQLWWSGFASKHDIKSLESSILLKYNIEMEDIHKYIPMGVTQVTITQRDSSVVNEYIIRHTNDDITIMEGTVRSPAQAYTFEIADVMEYEQKYGWVLGYEN